MADFLFCRIIRGEVPSRKVYEDELVYAFEDLNPQGPTHVLVVPKKHITGLKERAAEDGGLLGRCHLAAAGIPGCPFAFPRRSFFSVLLFFCAPFPIRSWFCTVGADSLAYNHRMANLTLV